MKLSLTLFNDFKDLQSMAKMANELNVTRSNFEVNLKSFFESRKKVDVNRGNDSDNCVTAI
jgi:hypothetical protein